MKYSLQGWWCVATLDEATRVAAGMVADLNSEGITVLSCEVVKPEPHSLLGVQFVVEADPHAMLRSTRVLLRGGCVDTREFALWDFVKIV